MSPRQRHRISGFDTLAAFVHSPARMKSMTGYGRGEAGRDGCKVTVEISSVNRKQGEIVLNLPRELEPLDARLRDEINRRVARGRLTARVTLHTADAAHARARLNVPLARAYAGELARLAKSLGLAGGVSLDALVRLPGVVESEEAPAEAEAFAPVVEAALAKAMTALMRMREREGEHLSRDLRRRVGAMRKLAAAVCRRAPRVAEDYRRQLLERIRTAGVEGVSADDERVVKEVVFFADRADITEELTRLESHFRQFDDSVRSTEPVGRTLDFLAQEMGREINTIGSKANDAEITRAVVNLKAELEKFREQAQNVE